MQGTNQSPLCTIMVYHQICWFCLHLSTDRLKGHTRKLEALGKTTSQQTRNLGSIIFKVVDPFTFVDPFTVSVMHELVSDVVLACLKVGLNKNLDTLCGQQVYLHIYRLGQRCKGRKNKRSASRLPRINRVLDRIIEKSRLILNHVNLIIMIPIFSVPFYFPFLVIANN